MMHMFQQDVETELQGSNGEPIRTAVIYEILANSIEAVKEAAPEHCFMAVTELTPLDDVALDLHSGSLTFGQRQMFGAFWMSDAMQRFMVLNGWHVQQRTMPPLGMMS